MKKITFFLFFILTNITIFAKIIDPKKFGIIPNTGKNLTDNFVELSKAINKESKNITVTFSKGVYIVGKQVNINERIYLEGIDILSLQDCNNIKISGVKGTKFIYTNNLKFGSFNPQTGELHPSKLPFYDKKYIAQIGCTFRLINCNKIEINNFEVDGNVTNTVIGGNWGDSGHQLWHYGFHISNSKNIIVNNNSIHHFALDGISVSGSGKEYMNINIKNSKFEYNGRQGFSWIGGSGLIVTNCKFNHTGRSKIQSSPGAGLDIEAEGGNEAKNGQFINCEFVNNVGCGIIADSGPSSEVQFTDCKFIGVSNWSAWVQKPKFTFIQCTFNGSFVHGYITTNFEDATKFYNCIFEDKKYNGKDVYGGFLLECDSRKMMIFERCNFTLYSKKLMWLNNGSIIDETKRARFLNCIFNIKNNTIPNGGNLGAMGSMNIENCTFNYFIDKGKKYSINEVAIKKTNVIVNYINQ